MATVSDITVIPTSGLNHIDALLDTGPDWNFLTPPGGQSNVLYFTFSVTSGNESAASTKNIIYGNQGAFSAGQQAAVRELLKDGGYLNSLTGIHFVETSNGDAAQIHLCNANIITSNVTGLCSWQSSYQYEPGTNRLVSYDADAYVYLDNVEFGAANGNLTPGTSGYETLLHEMGHALGLKHPFYDPSDDDPNPIVLPASQDNTSNTLMSYNHVGGPYTTYQQYDVAALKWLYGMDGLGGALGINSTTGARYITGTNGADILTGTDADDTLEGDGGNDMIDGGNGIDTAVFRGVRSNYTFAQLANGDLVVTSKDGIDGVDTLRSIEILKFADMSATRAEVLALDTVAPDKPTMVVTKNVNGYTTGNTPLVTGKAEAGSTVKIYTSGDNQLVGTATADANGLYTLKLNPFSDGSGYSVYATATDAAGNVSVASDVVGFKVDATQPVIPTYSMSYTPGSNQAIFSGTGEANTTIELVRGGDLQTIARTTVGSDGKWELQTSPLPNGDYTVSVVSLDLADNGTSAASRATLTVNSAANLTGTSGNDTFRPGAGNNAVDGGAGTDTVIYAGSRNNYTVAQEAWGFGVTDKVGNNGHDSLINVERVQFDDGWLALDIDGIAGQIFRLYTAVLGRPAEAAGMGYWMWRMENGTSLTTAASEFMNQPEFNKLYGINPDDTTFVTKLYNNVLHRDPEPGGFAYWMDVLAHSTEATKLAVRTQMLVDFSTSLENQANVVGTFQHGIDYTPWHQA
jgi:serralysin